MVMRIRIITVGNKSPKWIQEGFEYYTKRMINDIKIELVEIKPEKRAKNIDTKKAIEKEGEKILSKKYKDGILVNLDLNNKQLNTIELSAKFCEWQSKYKKITFAIGGADGLSEKCKQAAHYTWCISALTLPHLLVKVIIAESLYRSWTIIKKHPYNRE